MAHGRLPDGMAAEAPGEPWRKRSSRRYSTKTTPAASPATSVKLHRIAMGVRDRLSLDAWRILTELRDDMVPARARGCWSDDGWLAVLDLVLEKLSAFSGQAADGMTRDKGWLFLEIGRRLERVANLCDLMLHALDRPDAGESHRLLACWKSPISAMTYQSRYVFGPDAARVLDLLLADETNPRSIAFQLATLFQHIRGTAQRPEPPAGDAAISNLVMNVFSEIRLLDVDAIVQANRSGAKIETDGTDAATDAKAMGELSNLLTRTYSDARTASAAAWGAGGDDLPHRAQHDV